MIDTIELPNDLDLEQCVLGAILLEADAINSVIQIITTDNFFYHDRNKKVWKAIRLLYQEQVSIDEVTVFQKLLTLHKSKAQELAIYLTTLTGRIGSAANIEFHAIALKEKYVRRRTIQIGIQAQTMAMDECNDPFSVYDKTLTELDILNNEINRAQNRDFSDIITEKAVHLKEAATTHTYATGIKTFLNELDRVTLGFQATDLIIIAGRPSMGKTALAIDIARKQAKNIEAPVGIFSLEMSESQLADRILSADMKIPLEDIRKGGLKFSEWQTFDGSINAIKKYPIHICDKGGLNINEICSISKNWKIKFGIKAIYVDYLQLISNNDGNRNSSREQEISGISRRLKQLAKELHIPVIALSQLSRKCEERSDKRPQLSDLRESGAIEQDADVVIFPFRPEYYDDNAEKGLCELILGKNRNGRAGGGVNVYFDAVHQLFMNETSSF